MIRIARGAVPAILATEGEAACRALCTRVERDGEQYRLRFEPGIYGHISVYEALAAMQHNKCCYCECRIDRGTIDHYRPKGAIYQAPKVRVSSWGYYWLAYAWDNLLLACSDCNTRFKRELFPLEDPERRVLSHQAANQLTKEAPMLLDPTRDEPEEHIAFSGFTPVARTPRGRATIEVLQLDRPFLDAEREEDLGLVRIVVAILDTVRAGEPVPDELLRGACRQVVRFAADSRPYAGMIRSFLKSYLGAEFRFPLTTQGLLEWATNRA